MALETKVGTCKNLFCRDTCWKLINNVYGQNVFVNIHGARLRDCSFGETCRGAHSENEIHTLPHIHNFNCMDKSKLDLVSIYNNINKVFEESKPKVINEEFKRRLESFKKLNFVDLLNLWFDITCYHRKIKKEMKNDPSYVSEFSNVNKIPEFYLEDEDLVWSLERITKLCPKLQALISKIESKNDKPQIWDICLASINCKTGCHNISHMLCNDDLMYGKCDCMSLEEFENKKIQLKSEIETNKNLINPVDGYEVTKLNKKKKQSIQKKIDKLTYELDSLKRKIHFTENGMKPFSEQLKEFEESIIQKEAEKEKEICNRETEMTKVVKKKILKPVF